MLPSFLVCGVQKAATTSLYAYLRQHHQIYLPDTKELNYFNLNWERPLAWYEDHFAGWSGQPAVGEVSPLYLWDEHTPGRIAQTLHDPRLIFLLRNPIDRAYSNYWFNVARGAQNPRESFSAVIRSEEGAWRYLSKGLYCHQLSRYAAIFPEPRLLILFTEALQSQPQRVLQGIYDFLEVDPEIEVSATRKHNATRLPGNRLVAKVWSHWLDHRHQIRAFIPPVLADWSRQARQNFHRRFFIEQSPPPMSKLDRDYLREWYAGDVDKLTHFLGEAPPWAHDFARP